MTEASESYARLSMRFLRRGEKYRDGSNMRRGTHI